MLLLWRTYKKDPSKKLCHVCTAGSKWDFGNGFYFPVLKMVYSKPKQNFTSESYWKCVFKRERTNSEYIFYLLKTGLSPFLSRLDAALPLRMEEGQKKWHETTTWLLSQLCHPASHQCMRRYEVPHCPRHTGSMRNPFLPSISPTSRWAMTKHSFRWLA